MDHGLTFTLREVIEKGFEARCVGADGAHYLWHKDSGLRVDSRTGTTQLRDPTELPEALCFPTRRGLEGLEETEVRSACPYARCAGSTCDTGDRGCPQRRPVCHRLTPASNL